jgi:hypothetical protein
VHSASEIAPLTLALEKDMTSDLDDGVSILGILKMDSREGAKMRQNRVVFLVN